ncbi:MAG TPA: DUF1566 domain-containing protein [Polyangiaceae bacterium]
MLSGFSFTAALWAQLAMLCIGCGSSGAGNNERGALGGQAMTGGASNSIAPGGGDASSGGSTAALSTNPAGQGNTAGSGNTGGAGAGGSSGLGSDGVAGKRVLVTPFDSVTLQPDSSDPPVVDCKNQPDMTLCQITTSPDREYDICIGGVCVSPGCGDLSCNASAPHFAVPPSGGHTFLQRIPATEPIVADLVTGLSWQGCSAGTRGEVCADGAVLAMPWVDAVAYCDKLTWSGKSDWYLPDVFELMSIVDLNLARGSNPAIFPRVAESHRFWSSQLDRANFAWVVLFNHWSQTVYFDESTTDPYAVRCVRRGSSRNAAFVGDRFKISLSGKTDRLIEDPATGLMWQGCRSGHSGANCSGSPLELLPADFVAYCDELVWGGHDDWRLPSFKDIFMSVLFPPLDAGFYSLGMDEDVFDVDGSPYLGASYGWGLDAGVHLTETYEPSVVLPGTGGKYRVDCVRWNR